MNGTHSSNPPTTMMTYARQRTDGLRKRQMAPSSSSAPPSSSSSSARRVVDLHQNSEPVRTAVSASAAPVTTMMTPSQKLLAAAPDGHPLLFDMTGIASGGESGRPSV